MSATEHGTMEHWKKHARWAAGHSVMVLVTRRPRAAASLLFRQLAQDDESEGKALQ
jgi:hypothetical protein